MTTMNSPSAPQQPRLLDRVRLAIRAHHYSPRTEDAYLGRIKPAIPPHHATRLRRTSWKMDTTFEPSRNSLVTAM